MSTKKNDHPDQQAAQKGHSMEEKLEASKQEIQKLLEGVPGGEKLTELIERGKKKGSLSAAELMDVLDPLLGGVLVPTLVVGALVSVALVRVVARLTVRTCDN